MYINSTLIKEPSSVTFTVSDIDGESYRNAQGNVVRDRLTTKRKLECEWKGLTTDEISTLLSAVTDTFFTVTYLDAQEGTSVTKTFYVGDRTAPVYNYSLDIWESLKMNFIER